MAADDFHQASFAYTNSQAKQSIRASVQGSFFNDKTLYLLKKESTSPWSERILGKRYVGDLGFQWISLQIRRLD